MSEYGVSLGMPPTLYSHAKDCGCSNCENVRKIMKEMSDPNPTQSPERDDGWYRIRIESDDPWTCAEWWDSKWFIVGQEDTYKHVYEIGPRIPTPERLREIADDLEELADSRAGRLANLTLLRAIAKELRNG